MSQSHKSSNNRDIHKIFEFLQLVGRLKHLKRTGWVLTDVNDPETVAGHMYRMGILTFLLDTNDGLDTTRCMKLALVHDLAECVVGDITPKCGVASHEKHILEMEAMKKICLLAGPAGDDILALFQEYEAQETIEAKTVKDLDVFDMILQAFEYEKYENRPKRLQEFFDSTSHRQYVSPLITSLVTELHDQRKLFIESAIESDVPKTC